MRSRPGSGDRTDGVTGQLTDHKARADDLVLRRFDVYERIVHWITAVDVLVLIASGIILYIPSLSVLVGRRLLMENIHTATGIAALVPLVVVLVSRRGSALRADVRLLSRIDAREWRWFDRTRRMRLELGKFNPGQKLNAIFVSSGLVVLLCTGLILRFAQLFPLTLRQGATFVHDWFAFAVTALVIGHIAFAIAHPASLRAMFRGVIARSWAERFAPRWLDEARGEAAEKTR